MLNKHLTRLLALAGLLLGLGGSAHAADDAQTTLYQNALASPLRTDQDRAADARRKPLEFLQFAQVRPGMRVLDVAAGSGYTTQLLALVVGDTGHVWAQGTKSRLAVQDRLDDQPQANITPLMRPFDDPVPAALPPLDLITLIMNYHDITYMEVDRARMNQKLFDALKPGGHLVLMDHAAKSGAGISVAKTLHRIDEKIVIDEMQTAGFQLEQEGTFMRNPADTRDQAFFNMKIPSDQFALRFVKP